MKRHSLIFTVFAIATLSLPVHASDQFNKASPPTGPATSLSKEQVKKGLENGTYCTDQKGLAFSRGAIIFQNSKSYRCVQSYGQDFKENKQLAWVEIDLQANTAPANR